MPDDGAALLTTWRGTVLPQWVDYNGHLNDAYYMVVFSEATNALMGMIGLDDAGRKATGHTIYTLEAHINYLQEVRQDVAIVVRTQILGSDAKRLQIYQTLHRADDDTLLAANEQMLLNIDVSGPRAAPFAPTVSARVQMLTLAHKRLPRPKYAGRAIALPD
jgi:acyl-CoA thioester hydrolase